MNEENNMNTYENDVRTVVEKAMEHLGGSGFNLSRTRPSMKSEAIAAQITNSDGNSAVLVVAYNVMPREMPHDERTKEIIRIAQDVIREHAPITTKEA